MTAPSQNQVTLTEFEQARQKLPSAKEFFAGQTVQIAVNRLNDATSVKGVAFECREFGSGQQWVFAGEIVLIEEVQDLATLDQDAC